MRIGFIIYDNLDALTGGYLYDKYLVEYLRCRSHPVEIISIPRRSYAISLLDNFSPQLQAKLLHSAYDLLLQDELNHPSLCWLNRKVKQTLNLPIVTIVHQVLCCQPRTNVQNAFYRRIEKRYLRSVDAFIFNSETTCKNVTDLIHNNFPSIIASPGGDRLGSIHSSNHIQSRAHLQGPLKLLCIGNITPNKGLYPLIETLSQLSAEKWSLTVVGSLSMDRRYVRDIKKIIANKKLQRQIILTGPKDGNDLATILSNSHVFVMPYSYEGFGIAFLEAMAFGLPVIGSSEGAIKHFVQTGQNGFLIAPTDRISANEKIEHLYQDRARLASMGIAAMETFNAQPKWNDTLESLHDFLYDLVGKQRFEP